MSLIRFGRRAGARKNGFTLIELLVVIAIIAVIAIVVVLVLNPGELIKESRDANRLSDLKTLASALSIYSSQNSTFGGNVSTTYISVADPAATTTLGDACQGLGLSVPGTLGCAATSTFHKTDATGWIPINFASVSFGAPLPVLPVDPVNTASSGLYYTFNGSPYVYELSAGMESQKYGQGGSKDVTTNDGGQYTDRLEVGTSITLLPFDPNGVSSSSPGLAMSGVGASSITTSTALISWTTNQPADSTVRYGLSIIYGSTSYNAALVTSHGIALAGLISNTTYHFQVMSANTSSTVSSTDQTFTTTGVSLPPAAPSEDSPLNNATTTLTPSFKMTATDPNGDLLQYKVTIYSNAICTTVVKTDDETASQTGWSSQNASGSTAFSSGSQGTFTVQSALAASTTYYWMASAIDPWGSNTWTNSATCNSFATAALPGAPGTPTYASVASTTLTVNWTSATNANYYKIERSPNGTAFAQIATTTLLTYNDAGLTTSTTYWYRVRANNAAGDGPYSASSSVTTSFNTYSGYRYQRAITIASALVSPGGTALANFPILVSSTLPDMKASSSGGTIQNLVNNSFGHSVPADLIFSPSATCAAPSTGWEIEHYVPLTGEIEVWVNDGTLSSSTGLTFYECYDNPSSTAYQSVAVATWAGNYQAVYHLPNGTSLSVNDSTSNGLNGINHSTTATGGQIDGAGNFGGSAYIDLGGSGLHPNPITVSAWVNPSASTIDATIAAKGYDGTNTEWQLRTADELGTRVGFYTYHGGGYVGIESSTASIAVGSWNYVVGVYTGTQWMIYMNGTLDSTLTAHAPYATAQNMAIGAVFATGSPVQNWVGALDDVRISSIARTSDWIKTEYNNQSSPATFMTIGAATTP